MDVRLIDLMNKSADDILSGGGGGGGGAVEDEDFLATSIKGQITRAAYFK